MVLGQVKFYLWILLKEILLEESSVRSHSDNYTHVIIDTIISFKRQCLIKAINVRWWRNVEVQFGKR